MLPRKRAEERSFLRWSECRAELLRHGRAAGCRGVRHLSAGEWCVAAHAHKSPAKPLARPTLRLAHQLGIRSRPSRRSSKRKLDVRLVWKEMPMLEDFCPAYASHNPCSFVNHKQGSGGWALLASAQSLSAESGNRSGGAGAKAASRGSSSEQSKIAGIASSSSLSQGRRRCRYNPQWRA